MSPEFKPELNFRKRPLVIIDLETTGLDPDIHEILEVACLVVNQETLVVEKSFYAKVKPKHPQTASLEALAMNHYSEMSWVDARSMREVLEEINQFAKNGMFAGWNISFDRPFLENAAKAEGLVLTCDYHWIDVMSMACCKLWADKEVTRLGLSPVCKAIGLVHKNEHTAMGDAEATFAVYRYLNERQTKLQSI